MSHLTRRSRSVPAMALVLGLLASVITGVSAGAAESWSEIAREDGIVVTERPVEGRNLPAFRGIGKIEGSLYEVLAVLADAPRRTEWLHRCIEAHRLQIISPYIGISYSRTESPWPVSDRDVIVKTWIYEETPGQVLYTPFIAVEDGRMLPLEDAVRVQVMEGHYRLSRLDDKHTLVEYQVNADPGGLLPKWVARLASRDLPLVTLQNLRKQVRRTRGQYDEFLKRWDPARRAPTDPPLRTPPRWTGTP